MFYLRCRSRSANEWKDWRNALAPFQMLLFDNKLSSKKKTLRESMGVLKRRAVKSCADVIQFFVWQIYKLPSFHRKERLYPRNS